MHMWPMHMQHALKQLGYEYPYDEFRMEEFAGKWGTLDLEICPRVLLEGEENDILLSIFAIGSLDTPWVRQQLLPCLKSSHSKVRWASAICLGIMQEELALPILCVLLTEFLPPEEQYHLDGSFDWFYEQWRPVVAGLIGAWNYPNPLVIQTMFFALQSFWQLERRSEGMIRRSWRLCEEQLVYHLGRLGRFDVLAALDLPEEMVCFLRVQLVLGYLQELPFRGSLKEKPLLQKSIRAVLEQQYGLSPEKSEGCLFMYERKRTSYHAVVRQKSENSEAVQLQFDL